MSGNKIYKGSEKRITFRRKADKALNEGKEKLNTIFRNTNEQIIYMSVDGFILDVNDRVLDFYGYRSKDIIGKHFSDLGGIEQEEFYKAIDHFNDLIKGKSSRPVELKVFQKDKVP